MLGTKPAVTFLLACVLSGCKTGETGTAADSGLPPRGSAASPIAPPPTEAGPILCKSDKDCPRRACGPCKPGELIMNDRNRVSCARNPCTNSRAYCNPQGKCAVHPDTKFVEELRSEECQRLYQQKWSVLCKGKQGGELEACENIVDPATARDDDAACKAAREKLAK